MTPQRITAIAIDDDPGDAEILRNHLAAIPEWHVEFTHFTGIRDGVRTVIEENVDVVFLDYNLGDVTGLELLARIRREGVLNPIVILTGHGDEYVAAEVTRNGADGYLVKGDVSPELLRQVVENARQNALARRKSLEERQTIQRTSRQLAEMNEELAHASRRDALTGLLNRGGWEEAVKVEHERSVRYDRKYSISLLDIDHFKLLNDSQGHQAGDEVLRRVARIVLDATRDMDVVGRYGGEELTILLPETDADAASYVAERVRKAIHAADLPHPENRVADRVTASLGVASFRGGDWKDVLKRADEAMYLAKQRGRNRVCADERHEPAVAADRPIKQVVLVIDDDEADVELVRRKLEEISTRGFEVRHAADADSAQVILEKENPSLIFLDYYLGPELGTEVLKGIRAMGYLGPVLCFTGNGNERVAADLMRLGADDYVAKADVSADLLRRAMGNAAARHRQRVVEAENERLVAELNIKNKALEANNHRLGELYNTAHEFVDNVSHEFRTPLTVIKEFTSIIQDGLTGPITAEQSEYLATVLDRVDDLSTMIDDMLDISKLEAGLLGVVRKNCTAEHILNRVRKTLERRAAANQVRLAFTPLNALPEIYCDAEKIGRVIINLSINAMKFCKEGTEVTLWARHEGDQGLVRFGVTDQGSGIDPDKVSQIFDRFQQLGGEVRSSTKGFGLGLNIARELVHLNFGEIDVQSSVGQGSTFSFTVPTAEPDRLIGRYLDRIGRFRNGFMFVSLLVASVDSQQSDDTLDDVEQFLQHQIRRSDLLLNAHTGRWLLVAATNQRDLGSLMQRIQQSRQDANRNRPKDALPAVSLSIEGTWTIRYGRKDFIRRIQEEIGPKEPALARCPATADH
jgi:hypothetical protein